MAQHICLNCPYQGDAEICPDCHLPTEKLDLPDDEELEKPQKYSPEDLAAGEKSNSEPDIVPLEEAEKAEEDDEENDE